MPGDEIDRRTQHGKARGIARKPVIFARKRDHIHRLSGPAQRGLHDPALFEWHHQIVLAVNQQDRGIRPGREIDRRNRAQIAACAYFFFKCRLHRPVKAGIADVGSRHAGNVADPGHGNRAMARPPKVFRRKSFPISRTRVGSIVTVASRKKSGLASESDRNGDTCGIHHPATCFETCGTSAVRARHALTGNQADRGFARSGDCAMPPMPCARPQTAVCGLPCATLFNRSFFRCVIAMLLS